MTIKIRPLGFYVLIEMDTVEQVSEGGIVLPTDLISKEQQATDIGTVIAIGPTAYVGYPGCDAPDELSITSISEAQARGEAASKRESTFKFHPKTPAEAWGLKVGQKIEYRRFEGKESAVKGYEKYRYIPDSHIIGAIDDE